jgi:hypothetical protein
MAERTKGKIEIVRDHPDPITNGSLIVIRPVDRTHSHEEVTCVYGAPNGSEAHANAEFIVRAWNTHEHLVDALQFIVNMTNDGLTASDCTIRDRARAALTAAGAL